MQCIIIIIIIIISDGQYTALPGCSLSFLSQRIVRAGFPLPPAQSKNSTAAFCWERLPALYCLQMATFVLVLLFMNAVYGMIQNGHSTKAEMLTYTLIPNMIPLCSKLLLQG